MIIKTEQEETMPNSPENYSLITYLWVIGLSILGGTAHNIAKLRNGTLARFSIPEWVGDIAIAGFIGLMTFYLCEYAKLPRELTAAFVGIAAHMGTRAIVIFERFLLKRFGIEYNEKDIK